MYFLPIIDYIVEGLEKLDNVKIFGEIKMSSAKPKLVILAVYKRDGEWRGFCAPYDVSTNASTKKEAQSQLEKLVDLYEDGLKKYNFPQHLSVKEISDEHDRIMLEKIIEKITDDLNQKMHKNFVKYQLETQKKYSYRIENISGYYSEPVYY